MALALLMRRAVASRRCATTRLTESSIGVDLGRGSHLCLGNAVDPVDRALGGLPCQQLRQGAAGGTLPLRSRPITSSSSSPPSSSATAGGIQSIVVRQLVQGLVHETHLHRRPDGTLSQTTKATEDITLDLKLRRRETGVVKAVWRQAKATFLPAGYPDTVAPNYLEFVGWRALQNLSGTANGVLASSFLLYAVGLGQGVIPVAGAVNWVLKDGLGQAGTLLVARFMAQTFDDNARGWYIRGAMMMNIAIGVEICTVFAPDLFLFMGAAANSLKGLTWLAMGATCSAFNLSFQKNQNIADIHARSTTQAITVSLFGTAVGAWLATVVGQSPAEALLASTLLGSVNMYSALRLTKAVPLATLNPVRLRILAGQFVDSVTPPKSSGRHAGDAGDPKPAIVPPEIMADMDPIAFWPKRLSRPFLHAIYSEAHKLEPPHIGTPIHRSDSLSTELLGMLLEVYRDSSYMVFPMDGEMHLILRDSATDRDVVYAILNTELLLREMPMTGGPIQLPPQELQTLLAASLASTCCQGESFLQTLQGAGWSTSPLILEGAINRATW